jgi:hypothetical protein
MHPNGFKCLYHLLRYLCLLHAWLSLRQTNVIWYYLQLSYHESWFNSSNAWSCFALFMVYYYTFMLKITPSYADLLPFLISPSSHCTALALAHTHLVVYFVVLFLVNSSTFLFYIKNFVRITKNFYIKVFLAWPDDIIALTISFCFEVFLFVLQTSNQKWFALHLEAWLATEQLLLGLVNSW